jgi:hypothetical protein
MLSPTKSRLFNESEACHCSAGPGRIFLMVVQMVIAALKKIRTANITICQRKKLTTSFRDFADRHHFVNNFLRDQRVA